MKLMGSERGVARGVWIVVALGAIVAGGLLALRALLAGFADPVKVAARLETLIGEPVTVENVEVHPLRSEAVVRGFELTPSTRVESAVIGLNLRSALSGDWELRKVELIQPVWRVPRANDDIEPFLKGLMVPLYLATRADLVTLGEGVLVEPAGGDTVATAIRGEMSRRGADGSGTIVESKFAGSISGLGDVSASGLYSISGTGDTIRVEGLRVSAIGQQFMGSAAGSIGSPSSARADVSSKDFHGGSLMLSLTFNEEPEGLIVVTHLVVKDSDGAGLLRDRFALSLITAGRLNADLVLEGGANDLLGYGPGGFIARGDVSIENAALDSGGPLAELIPVTSGAEGPEIERASARLEISRIGVHVRDMLIEGGGMAWTGRGRVASDGALSGSLLGRVPAEAIGREGTALALVTSLLAGRDGRVPAAFTVAGTLERPVVSFDLEATAEAAAASGRPQARQLVKAMSRSDVEKYSRTVDDYFRRLRGR